MPELTELFISFLKQKNLQWTHQRADIVNTFVHSKHHVSVEELYNSVKKKNSKVGHTTVFRTLKLLCDAGLAKEHDFGDKTMRYEIIHGQEHHDHLVCLTCGEFIEAVDSKIEKLQDKMCEKFGFEPVRHSLVIYGHCKKCRGKKK